MKVPYYRLLHALYATLKKQLEYIEHPSKMDQHIMWRTKDHQGTNHTSPEVRIWAIITR